GREMSFFVLQLAHDHAQYIRRDAGVELPGAAQVGNQLFIEQLGDGFEELGNGRPVLHHSSTSWSNSHSVSAVRRPMAASSTLGFWPSRNGWVILRQITPQRKFPKISQ